jgi:CRISPR-associated protein Csx17
VTVDLALDGCRVEPLGSYLKALGALRVVAEQADPAAAGFWRGDVFRLHTSLDEAQLIEFFMESYSPTPLVAPWNKGSGFGPDDATKSRTAFDAVERIAGSVDIRLARYRETISQVRRLADSGFHDLAKEDQVARCRSVLPDDALAWIDAAVVLTTDSRSFPPLLGTGGNDGRFDFSSNFMQRLLGLFDDLAKPSRRTRVVERLELALFSPSMSVPLADDAIGQFDPGGAGGPASSSLGKGGAVSNPWDFVLLLEGALLFASGAARRMSAASASASMPFIVATSAAGFATATRAESTRGEIWAPVWREPTQLPELARFISEGRAEQRPTTTSPVRQATNGLDVARAIASLGVDRGIDTFARHAFIERNGLSTVAVPLGRIKVSEHGVARVPILGQLEGWLNRFRSLEQPASVPAFLRRIDDAQFRLVATGRASDLQAVLVAVAQLQRLALSSRSIWESARPPLLRLPASGWIDDLDDGSLEFELAAALASLRFSRGDRSSLLARALLADPRESLRPPLVGGLGVRQTIDVLADCLIRLSIEHPGTTGPWLSGSGEPSVGDGKVLARPASLAAALALAEGVIDTGRLGELLGACLLLDWSKGDRWRQPSHATARAAPAYAVLAPFFHHRNWPGVYALSTAPAPSSWARRLEAGAVVGVVDDALRRLRIARLRPLLRSPAALAAGVDGSSLAAALLVPLTDPSIGDLLHSVAGKPSGLDQAPSEPEE